MLGRRKCESPGCENFGELNKKFKVNSSGEFKDRFYYRKFCSTHKRKFYAMPSTHERDRERLKKLKTGVCSLCGWVGPCDNHRLKPGIEGGVYAKDNIVEICPNCHRLEHQKMKARKLKPSTTN